MDHQVSLEVQPMLSYLPFTFTKTSHLIAQELLTRFDFPAGFYWPNFLVPDTGDSRKQYSNLLGFRISSPRSIDATTSTFEG